MCRRRAPLVIPHLRPNFRPYFVPFKRHLGWTNTDWCHWVGTEIEFKDGVLVTYFGKSTSSDKTAFWGKSGCYPPAKCQGNKQCEPDICGTRPGLSDPNNPYILIKEATDPL